MTRVMKSRRTVALGQIKKLASTSKHRKNCAALLASQKYPLHSRI